MNMRRGEVYWIAFDPSQGSEVKKTRPAIVISTDHANVHLDRFQVVPLTTNTERVYPGEALVTVSGQLSKMMGNQITTVSKMRVKNKISSVSAQDMQGVDVALRLQLGL
jgi:mRNA interferase MazF